MRKPPVTCSSGYLKVVTVGSTHQKSMELGHLTALVASMAGWVEFMVNTDEFDIAPASGPSHQSPQFESRAQILQVHEDGLKRSITALKNTTDEHLRGGS